MVEFIGLGLTNDFSEVRTKGVEVLDLAFVEKLLDVHEENNWDGVIFHYSASGVDPAMMAAFASRVSHRLKLVVAVRPNTCHPTFLAKQLATLDRISEGGRIRLHVIAGGYSLGQVAEGDHLDKDRRYARAGEFIDICRNVWTSSSPFSYSGEYYSVDRFTSKVTCQRSEGLFISTAGTSDAALRMAARCSDRHAVFGLPLAEAKTVIATLEKYCEEEGRAHMPEIQMQFRSIIGDTREDARKKAGEILERIRENFNGIGRDRAPQTTSAQKSLAVLERGEWHDTSFWAGAVAETSGAGNSSALVGTPVEIAEALCRYHDIGVECFGLNGYETIEDVTVFGREVIPLVRADLGS
ncbi:LLM class flavin-dependent oxidoreductase [Nocardia sp. X0981]